jgi:hypothetical protein
MEDQMPEDGYGINSVADRRYYHFVAVNGGGVGLGPFWRKLGEMGEIERPEIAVPVESPAFKLEHRKLRLKKPYARGEAAITLSEHGNGRPPFLYDLFAARIDFKDNPCLDSWIEDRKQEYFNI